MMKLMMIIIEWTEYNGGDTYDDAKKMIMICANISGWFRMPVDLKVFHLCCCMPFFVTWSLPTDTFIFYSNRYYWWYETFHQGKLCADTIFVVIFQQNLRPIWHFYFLYDKVLLMARKSASKNTNRVTEITSRVCSAVYRIVFLTTDKNCFFSKWNVVPSGKQSIIKS